MLKFIAGAAAATILLGAVSFVRQPCTYEDSPGVCYWDAQSRGNHEGQSFIRITDGWVISVP